MAEKQKAKEYKTPRVTLIFPHLIKPDTKFVKNGNPPKYQTRFRADPKDPVIAEIIRKLDEAAAEAETAARQAIEEAKLPPPKKKERLAALKVTKGYEDEYDGDTPTGYVIFKADTSAKYKDKQGNVRDRVLPIFDHNRQQLNNTRGFDSLVVGSGTVARLIVTIGSGHANDGAYAKLYLSAVQLITVSAGGGGANYASQFDDEDGDDIELAGGGDSDAGEGDAPGDSGDEEL